MSHRVFISSVMRDFASERAAAKEAVVRLRQQPVMAEDFGAQPFSSQTACLEGVRSSHYYVGIFGPRYGYVAPGSGLAATEEEFNEARIRGLPILCFEKRGPKETDQEAFLRRIKNYENGYSFAFFDTLDELKMTVVQALHDQIGRPGLAVLDAAGAASVLDRHQWGSRRHNTYRVWLGAVLLPGRQGEPYLDVLQFSEKVLRDRLLQPALFGPSSIFRIENGVGHTEEGEALVFHQSDERRQPQASLEVHADGTLVFGTALGRESTASSLTSLYIIDQEEVERAIEAFTTYAGFFYRQLPRGELITEVYVGTSLTGVDSKTFGRLPAQPISSVAVPMHSLPNPLKVPTPPLRVPRAELANPSALASRLTEYIARAFRQANAYLFSRAK